MNGNGMFDLGTALNLLELDCLRLEKSWKLEINSSAESSCCRSSLFNYLPMGKLTTS